jgi:LacI family transcriptional regulator
MTIQKPQRFRRATIEDVAEHARVSRAAVSKVLRNAYGVSDEMRARVTQSIEALEYRPRISARGMRGSTFTLGVAVNDPANGFMTDIVQGASAAVAGTQFQIIMSVLDDPRGSSYRAIEGLYDRQVDGILVISPLADPAWLEDMGRKVPLVQLGVHERSEHHDTIVGDDVAGVRLVMNHLLDLGHTRIAHVTHTDPEWVLSPNRPHIIRETQYRRIMHEAGLDDAITVIPAMFEDQAAYLELRRRFAEGFRPTAIFAGNDDAALGVMRAAAEFPELRNLSIAGYDDAHFSSHPRIGLTTVSQQGHEMGQHAARLLLERVEGRTESRYIETSVRLVTRTSTLAPTP